MVLTKERSKVKKEEFINLHKDCKKYFSEIEMWRDRLEILKNNLKKYAADIPEDNVLEFRMLCAEVDELLHFKIETLLQKIFRHQWTIENIFKTNQLSASIDLSKEHDLLNKQVKLVADSFYDIRERFLLLKNQKH